MCVNYERFEYVRDPFAKDAKGETDGEGPRSLIHIRNQQRNGKKSVTSIQGLAPPQCADHNTRESGIKVLTRKLKKRLKCNGTFCEHGSLGIVIQLQGDCRCECKKILSELNICSKEEIVIHGPINECEYA